MIFGSTNDGTAGGTAGGSSRRFAWCDQENPGAWDYTNVTSQAGFLDIEPASPIICAIASRVGVLFWTGKKVYASNFLGSPYIYNYVELADGTTPWSPQSMSTTSALVLWMSEQGVFSYDGTSILPVQQMVRSWIDDDIDQVAVRELSFSSHLGEFNEWWWFFPDPQQPVQQPGGHLQLQGRMVESGAAVALGWDYQLELHQPPDLRRRSLCLPARGRHRLSELGRQRPGHAAVRRIVRSQPCFGRAADHHQAAYPRRRGDRG